MLQSVSEYIFSSTNDPKDSKANLSSLTPPISKKSKTHYYKTQQPQDVQKKLQKVGKAIYPSPDSNRLKPPNLVSLSSILSDPKLLANTTQKPIQINPTNLEPNAKAVKIKSTSTIESQNTYYLYIQALYDKFSKVLSSDLLLL
ncbi:14938_t:CDS:2 [Dentiscutata erythropus]|uniref:14938_t:CDS:1 n=1 Tax=Dentiscutata erythropus TaxID=1348616 RepID=A0A9N8WIM9_9GLOM|nr:14938_t:CDS:2 [Dentiscutata erythropus]